VGAGQAPAEVASGVYRLGTKWVNFHLVVDGDEAVLVDAGYPGYLEQVARQLSALGLGLDAIRAVIITHHHVDHAGTAEEVRSRANARVFVHEGDAPRVRGEHPSHPPSGFYREAWRPSMIRYLAHTIRVGGARYRPVSDVTLLEDGLLDVPARPRIVYTPGHTKGHCSVLLEDRGTLLSGDAMMNFDYASGGTGLKLHRFNEDREGARASLQRFDGLDVETVLFGHGDPWTKGLERAVEQVRNRRAES
jgi:glyoxylase-like metal-dependent hydrolase (beta-lactamase superfamily II)